MRAAESVDSTVIRRIAGGDREALGRLYDQCAPTVFAFALRLLGNRADAEDLLQEVFLHVWRQAAAYREDRGSPVAWLMTITRSRGIDRLRSLRRRGREVSSADAGTAQGVGSAPDHTAGSEARLTVEPVLAELPEPQRTVLELAYYGGLTQTEIASRLGEPVGTVKTRIRAGLQRLRELLGAQTHGAG